MVELWALGPYAPSKALLLNVYRVLVSRTTHDDGSHAWRKSRASRWWQKSHSESSMNQSEPSPTTACPSHSQVTFSISESTEAGQRQHWPGALWRQELCHVLEWGTSWNKTKLLPTQTDKKNNGILKCLDIPHRLYPEYIKVCFGVTATCHWKITFSPPDNL